MNKTDFSPIPFLCIDFFGNNDKKASHGIFWPIFSTACNIRSSISRFSSSRRLVYSRKSSKRRSRLFSTSVGDSSSLVLGPRDLLVLVLDSWSSRSSTLLDIVDGSPFLVAGSNPNFDKSLTLIVGPERFTVLIESSVARGSLDMRVLSVVEERLPLGFPIFRAILKNTESLKFRY